MTAEDKLCGFVLLLYKKTVFLICSLSCLQFNVSCSVCESNTFKHFSLKCTEGRDLQNVLFSVGINFHACAFFRETGIITQIIFCAQSGASIGLNVCKWAGESRFPSRGLFRPWLKTFVAPFLPTQLTAPGSPGIVLPL